VNDDTLSPEAQLVHDFLAIIHRFSARLDGLRPYQKVIRDAAVQKS
jgi:putative resolvase